MLQEDMTFEQVVNVYRLATVEYSRHLEYCPLCLPGTWLCPDAHLLLGNMQHWETRVAARMSEEERPQD